MPIKFRPSRLTSLVASALVVVMLLSFGQPVQTAQAQGGIFGGGGGGGSIFDGIRRGVSDIFDSLGVGVPGGAIIPGISPAPAGGVPSVPSDGLPPLDDPSKKIKVTLEWDAVSIGTEKVDPVKEDPLKQEHIDFITQYGCPPCAGHPEPAPQHEGETWHYCAIQPSGCETRNVKPALYGWCGAKPKVLDDSVPDSAQEKVEGPNEYTLPSAVSNKYIRRDGYTYQCVRACGGDSSSGGGSPADEGEDGGKSEGPGKESGDEGKTDGPGKGDDGSRLPADGSNFQATQFEFNFENTPRTENWLSTIIGKLSRLLGKIDVVSAQEVNLSDYLVPGQPTQFGASNASQYGQIIGESGQLGIRYGNVLAGDDFFIQFNPSDGTMTYQELVYSLVPGDFGDSGVLDYSVGSSLSGFPPAGSGIVAPETFNNVVPITLNSGPFAGQTWYFAEGVGLIGGVVDGEIFFRESITATDDWLAALINVLPQYDISGFGSPVTGTPAITPSTTGSPSTTPGAGGDGGDGGSGGGDGVSLPPGQLSGKTCLTDNYMEFQTQLYGSNAISMYVRVENLSGQDINNVIVKVNTLDYSAEEGYPMPHNIDFPVSSVKRVHGNNVAEGTVSGGASTPMHAVDGELVIGPIDLPAGDFKLIPLQPKSAEYMNEVPGAATAVAQSPIYDLAQVEESVKIFNESVSSNVQKAVDWVASIIPSEISSPPPAQAITAQEFCDCMAGPLADYMNGVVGSAPENVSVGTTVFNLTNLVAFDCLPDAMAAAGGAAGSADVFMGNAYNLGPGGGISRWVENAKTQAGGNPIVLTEIGAIEQITAGVDRGTAIENLKNEVTLLCQDPQIQAAMFFASFGNRSGGGNPDDSYSYNWFSDDELRYIMSDAKCDGQRGKFGINPGSYAGSMDHSHYQTMASLGMGQVVIIARAGSEQAVAADILAAQAAGLSVTIRIGVGDDSGGFDNYEDYVAFLQAVSELTGGADFTAIGGPNEPELEPWIAPECGGAFDVDEELDDEQLAKKLGIGGIVPRDYNFICDRQDDAESERCGGAGLPEYIIPRGSDKFREFRDTTGIGGCGYWASSNNSVIGPIQVAAEYGGAGEGLSRSVLLASIPVGGRILDDQARPYGWPIQGQIEEDWGFTGEAAGQGYYRFSGPAMIDGGLVFGPGQEYAEYRCCGQCVTPR